jgi:hypothetical protein
VAGVFDGHSLRLLVDGHPVGDPIAVPQSIAYALTSSDSYFGTYQGTCALPLRGDIDLIRLWRGPLSSDFIGMLADSALLVTPTGPPTIPPSASVPIATPSDSHADAPASRTTLAPIAPGTSFVAANVPADGVAPKPIAGAPARACAVRAANKRVRAGRRTVLTVRVALRGKPLKSVRVVAIDAARRKLASAVTARNGRARLGVKPTRRGTVAVRVVGRTDCSSAALRVLRALRH